MIKRKMFFYKLIYTRGFHFSCHSVKHISVVNISGKWWGRAVQFSASGFTVAKHNLALVSKFSNPI